MRGRWRAWTMAELARAEAALRSGVGPAEVARSLGRSRAALKQAMTSSGRAWGVLLRAGREARIDEALRLLRSCSFEEVCGRMGIRPRTLHKWRQERGVGSNAERRKLGPRERTAALTARLDGTRTHKELAMRYGVSVATVHRAVQEQAEELGVYVPRGRRVRRRS